MTTSPAPSGRPSPAAPGTPDATLSPEECKNPAHLTFVTTAITAFEQEGPDARPLLKGCPQAAARRIFEEVTEAYITAEDATCIQARGSTLVRAPGPARPPGRPVRPPGRPVRPAGPSARPAARLPGAAAGAGLLR
ncbi:hypothetical protein [Streptomyces sp. NPDC007088]|uniref:hypothetical protein n=1 Tax=Streptomyces sp. NPDC007088 TaxID=3364773 RepID=UPI00369F0213